MLVLRYEVELQQPAAIREYFRERVVYYRQQSRQLPKGTDAVYLQEAKEWRHKYTMKGDRPTFQDYPLYRGIQSLLFRLRILRT
ncbi:DNA polymerase III subunit theta [Pantoea deleyi]|uniref:DNA polymerase III subunit theta n=1 Tax=Pantoea deleyi TaxID=470932 RepID=UPI0035D4144D